jgi:lysophospholipase L1-like esterase
MYPRDYVKRRVYAIGDSVMLGAVGAVDNALGDVDIDAKVGRQLAEALPLLRERIARGVLSDVVVIHLGNNGPFREAQLADLLALLRDVRHVVLINLKLPRSYESRNNDLISAAAADPRVRVIDWRTASLAAKGLFGGDGIHLTAAGARLYAGLIAAAVCPGALQ